MQEEKYQNMNKITKRKKYILLESFYRNLFFIR